MDKGLVHLYWGEGKGKTTAAVGLAVRALGRGMKVVFLQFLKDGKSGEIGQLRQLGAKVYSGKAGTKFASQMTPQEREESKAAGTQNLIEVAKEDCDLLVLDEACAAWQLDMVDRQMLKEAVLLRPEGREIVLTGRDPAMWMMEAADYSTEMRCIRHPYQRGVTARKGVEF